MIFALAPANSSSASTLFSDVGTTHRAQAEIYYLLDGGITGGISATKFGTDQLVTREQAAALIGRSLGLNGEKRATDFPDVSTNNFASGYIQQMVDKGIISGFKDGSFGPKQTLTRGQMAVLISRAYNYGATSTAAATNALMEKGISLGMEDGSFGEDLTIKRADFAVFLARGINASFRKDANVTFSREMFVNVNDLNFRQGPSTDFPSMGKLNNGDKVEYAYTIGQWSYVRANGQTGFLHNAYLQLTKPDTTTPPPTPTPVPTEKPLDELVVIIDPGHGGTDPGGTGNGFVEKNVVLNVARHMNSYFQATPLKPKMTRTGDYFITLDYRTEFAAREKGDVFVSLHTNALNGSANGQETFYYAKTASTNPNVAQSRALAIYLQARMQEAWDLSNRGVNPFGYGNLHVLRENTMPAALIEMGFIDSPKDIEYIKLESQRKLMGKALYLGVLDYYYHYKGREDVLPLYNITGDSPSKRLH
ncbi:cell wall hydrolase [Paenisporosarcina cavernae]|uniref:Cell wall hydrolase n=2 Tax=Paenisporosarcina cavernae TaxID=2320858 RepID=A0A385YVN8_9BACL|nr:cell wall hydrolase [Paenisporosarcina cavernae]